MNFNFYLTTNITNKGIQIPYYMKNNSKYWLISLIEFTNRNDKISYVTVQIAP